MVSTTVHNTVYDTVRYAKRSKTSRVEWRIFTQKYFLERPTLVAVLLLVDASIPPQPADLDAADWLGNARVWFVCPCLLTV